MENVVGFLIFLVVMAVVVAVFYGIWKLFMWSTRKSLPRLTDEKLVKAYSASAKNKRIIYSIIFFLFLGFFAIYFYYLFKAQHEIYRVELVRRNVEFTEEP